MLRPLPPAQQPHSLPTATYLFQNKHLLNSIFLVVKDLLLTQVPEKILKMTMSLKSLNLGTYSNSIQGPYEVRSVLNNKS